MTLLDGSRPADIEVAASVLARGELLGFPTETVYGLGARADQDAAVARIYRTKGRPSGHPLIVHVADAEAAAPFVAELPGVAQRLMARFWPGPLTVIVPRAPGVGAAAAGGQDSIGLRCPDHPVALALLAEARRQGVPGVAGPSANRFGRVSPTTAAHVLAEFDGAVPVLDGGPCSVGIESAIVDCSRGRAVLLRPGVLTRAQIEVAAGEPLHDADAAAPRASGTLASHYAPRARVRLLTAAELALALPRAGAGVAVYSRSVAVPAGLLQRVMPRQADQVAQALFSVLRAFDDEGAQQIWVEVPPAAPEWEGVHDRLRRAAAT